MQNFNILAALCSRAGYFDYSLVVNPKDRFSRHKAQNRKGKIPSLVAAVVNVVNKTSNTFLFLFSNKLLVIRTGSQKLPYKITHRSDPDQTASSEAD